MSLQTAYEELLNKYYACRRSVIGEYSTDIADDIKALNQEVQELSLRYIGNDFPNFPEWDNWRHEEED